MSLNGTSNKRRDHSKKDFQQNSDRWVIGKCQRKKENNKIQKVKKTIDKLNSRIEEQTLKTFQNSKHQAMSKVEMKTVTENMIENLHKERLEP